MQLILAIFQAIAAIPKIKAMLDQAIASYMSLQDEWRRQAIQDAAIDLAKAKTEEEKKAALLKRFKAGGN
jgi:hypothetical protein